MLLSNKGNNPDLERAIGESVVNIACKVGGKVPLLNLICVSKMDLCSVSLYGAFTGAADTFQQV